LYIVFILLLLYKSNAIIVSMKKNRAVAFLFLHFSLDLLFFAGFSCQFSHYKNNAAQII